MTQRTTRWWRRGGRLLAELLVVFVGVYAAFALNTWREDRPTMRGASKSAR